MSEGQLRQLVTGIEMTVRVAGRAVTELTGKEKDEAVDRLKRVMSSYIQQEAEYKAGIAAHAVVKEALRKAEVSE